METIPLSNFYDPSVQNGTSVSRPLSHRSLAASLARPTLSHARTYRLYALSNVASLSSLLLFPLWFERVMTSSGLSYLWSALFIVFVVCCGYVAYRVLIAHADASSTVRTSKTLTAVSTVGTPDASGHASENRPSSQPLSALASAPRLRFFYAGGRNQSLCQDIASTPFLWILPLCLYLVSFILCFDAPRWYARRVYGVLGLIGLYGVIAMRTLDDSELLSDGWLANGIVPYTAPLLEWIGWYSPPTIENSTWIDWLKRQSDQATFDVGLVGKSVYIVWLSSPSS